MVYEQGIDDVSNLILFASIISLASISPGPNNILVINHAIQYGVGRIAPTIIGNLACLLLIALAAALGVGAVLAGSPNLFRALQLVGAAYLGYVGVKSLLAALRAQTVSDAATAPGKTAVGGHGWQRFRQAFLMSATNPKSVLFLAAVFPSFIDPQEPALGQFVVLFAVLTTVVCTIHLGLALLAASISRLVGNARFARGVKLTSGFAFLGFAAGIVWSATRG